MKLTKKQLTELRELIDKLQADISLTIKAYSFDGLKMPPLLNMLCNEANQALLVLKQLESNNLNNN